MPFVYPGSHTPVITLLGNRGRQWLAASFPETRRAPGFRLVSGWLVQTAGPRRALLEPQPSRCGWAGRTQDVDFSDVDLRNTCFARPWCPGRLRSLPGVLPPDRRPYPPNRCHRGRSGQSRNLARATAHPPTHISCVPLLIAPRGTNSETPLLRSGRSLRIPLLIRLLLL